MTIQYRNDRPQSSPTIVKQLSHSRTTIFIAVALAIVLIALSVLFAITRLFERAVTDTLTTNTSETISTLQQFQRIPAPIINSELAQVAIKIASMKQTESHNALQLVSKQGQINDLNLQLKESYDQFGQLVDESYRLVKHNSNEVRQLLSWAISVTGAELEQEARWRSIISRLPQSRVDPVTTQLRVENQPLDNSTLRCTVADQVKRHIAGLTSVDFQVHDSSGKHWPHFHVNEVSASRDDSSVTLLIDCSSSMEGPRMEQLKSGATEFVSTLHNRCALRVVSFASDVVPLTRFNDEQSVQKKAIQEAKPYGTTELAEGLQFAVTDLVKRPGRRYIVLCTDGDDPKLKPKLNDIIATCIKHQVQIAILAIQDQSVDLLTLDKLATATGGDVLQANNPREITEKLQAFATRHTAPFYQVKIFAPGEDLSRFKVSLLNQTRPTRVASANE